MKNPIGYTVWRYYYARNIGNATSFWYMSVGLMVYFIIEQIGAKQKCKKLINIKSINNIVM